MGMPIDVPFASWDQKHHGMDTVSFALTIHECCTFFLTGHVAGNVHTEDSRYLERNARSNAYPPRSTCGSWKIYAVCFLPASCCCGFPQTINNTRICLVAIPSSSPATYCEAETPMAAVSIHVITRLRLLEGANPS